MRSRDLDIADTIGTSEAINFVTALGGPFLAPFAFCRIARQRRMLFEIGGVARFRRSDLELLARQLEYEFRVAFQGD